MAQWGTPVVQGLLLLVVIQWMICFVLNLECPHGDDIHDTLLGCLQNVTMEGVKVGDDVSEVERNCREGGYDASVRCVQQLFAACSPHDEQSQHLYTFARVNNINRSFHMLCKHFALYSSQSECMQRQDSEIAACARRVSRQLKTRYDAHIDQKDSMLSTLKSYCAMQWAERNCTTTPVTKACGTDIGHLISVVMTGLIPPVCQFMKEDMRSPSPPVSSATLTSHLGVLLLSLCTYSCLRGHVVGP